MEAIDYDTKFNEMQKYIPFLDRVIEKLKNSDQDKPRKAQLEKMQTLHNLLHNKEKKLKIETLLKCESVLKKLYAKIEKSETIIPSEVVPSTTTTGISSDTTTSEQAIKTINSVHKTASGISQQKNKFVPHRNLIEIHTCPASPPHLGEEDFRPPVEIPTERRSSPVKFMSSPRWDPKNSKEPAIDQTIARIQNRSVTSAINKYQSSEKKRPSRWSDTGDRTQSKTPIGSSAASSSSSSSNHHRSWSSSATSTSTKNHRSHVPASSKQSSEEENWDSPEEETAPKPKSDPKPTLMASSKHQRHHNHHRHHETHPQPPPPPPPDSPPPPPPRFDTDLFKNQLYHETIYKYKTPDSSSIASCMNPPPPDARTPSKQHSTNMNVFNRLGDKIDTFENFRIQVRNDGAKPKPPKSLPLPPPALLVPAKPIVDVLKSPPLSADDIDDLLNESLEAAMEQQKNAKNSKDCKTSSLDVVRKKLAMISNPSSPVPEALSPQTVPPPKATKPTQNIPEEPFSRRSIPKTATTTAHEVSSQNQTKTPVQQSISSPLPSPQSPPPQSQQLLSTTKNPMDVVVERLALKYKPHKRRQSVSADGIYSSQTENPSPAPIHNIANPISRRRDSMISPIHGATTGMVTDPRLSKNIGNIPKPNIPPVPNVLPTINHFDPRLRKTHLLNNTAKPLPTYPHHSSIPSLLDLQVNIPLAPNCIPPQMQHSPLTKAFNVHKSKPSPPIQNYNAAPSLNRVPDPRIQKSMKMYPDKFNAERNDKTERMKYLESKRNKPPEPKTYGEYRQSKCRQQKEAAVDDEPKSTLEETSTPVVPTIQSLTPSALDKMYRNADYGQEMGGKIHGFKIPKKPKPPEPSVEKESAKLKEVVVEPEPTEVVIPKNPPETMDPSKKPTDKSKPKDEKLPNKEAVLKTQPVIEEKKKDLQDNKKTQAKKSSQDDVENCKISTATQVKSLKESKSTFKDPQKKIEDSSKTVGILDPIVPIGMPEVSQLNSTVSESLDESANESRLVIDEDSIIIESSTKESTVLEPPNILEPQNNDKSQNIVEPQNIVETQNIVEPKAKEKSPEPVKNLRSRRSRNKKNVPKPTPSLETKAPEKEQPKEEPAKEPEKKEETPVQEEEFKPRRITTRRSTIIMREAAEAAAAAEKQSTDTPAPIGSPRRRSASDIFSPTTDNSIVSTLNIITGKRRTRASINFNEKNTKKPSTPKAAVSAAVATPTPSPAAPAKSNQSTPRTRGKSTDSKQSKKTPTQPAKKAEAVEAKKKDSSEDGQICAVSSTTTDAGGPPHTEPLSISVGSATSPTEEPSSSNSNISNDQPSGGLTDENKKKFIEGFLLSIADPTTNKDRILEMLKTVLDETKLEQVKNILYSPEKGEAKHDEEPDKIPEEPHTEVNKPRATRTKKNELDRLNEDIRDMFICQGVVTATGRRMCTLAKESTPSPTLASPSSNSSSSRKTPVPQSKSKKKATPSPPVAATKSTPVAAPKSTPVSATKTPVAAPKRPMRKAKVVISPLNMRALRSRKPKPEKSPPKMPVLAPNTPIKIPKEENGSSSDEDIPIPPKTTKAKTKPIKSLSNKPKPKSRQQSPATSERDSDSSDDDIELAYLRNKLKRKDEVVNNEPQNAKKPKLEENKKEKEKAPQKGKQAKKNIKLDVDEEVKVDLPKEEEEFKPIPTEIAKAPSKTPIPIEAAKAPAKQPEEELFKKNTNPEHHTKSDYAMCCVICKERARFIAPHYLTVHNDSEIYTSRLPQNVLDDLKQNKGNRADYSVPKKPQIAYHYNCPFCDFSTTHALRGWMEHFTIHTGEYMYKCSNCFKAMNSGTYMADHIKKFCPTAKKINRDPINLQRGQGIYGYVCHLCNYTQMLRVGIVRHLKVHHEVEDEVSLKSIIQVKLIDIVGVPKMEDNKGNESATAATDTSAAADSSVLNTSSEIIASTPQKELSNKVVVESKQLEEEDPLKITESDVISKDKSKEETSTSLEPSISIAKSSITPELPLEKSSVETTSKVIEAEKTVAKVSSASTKENILSKPPQAPPAPPTVAIEVFLPRDLASPTSLDLAESLKSIEKENEQNDSETEKAQTTPKKMTIAERLSQRFKNIEKQVSDASQVEIETSLQASTSEVELAHAERTSTIETNESPPASDGSLNESGKLIIDQAEEYEPANASKSVEDDGGSESDDANENDEDDNDNWEDIEITETTTTGNGAQKDKNKNKSIFQTLSRLYASIAPKKLTSKKIKEKEASKKKAECVEKTQKVSQAQAIPKTTVPDNHASTLPTPEVTLDPLLTGSTPSSNKRIYPPTQERHQHQPQMLPSLSEFILDSQSDSLDLLLNSNFNCLEGDGTSFPHLDLNDLDSTIFALPEEPANIQDAIEMVTDFDSNRYDVLGNTLPPKQIQAPKQSTQSQSTQPWTVQKIGNFGFSLNGDSVKYYCLVNSCAFLFSDHPDGLQNHFLLEHPNLKWDGYCHTCRMQVSYGNVREMQHMLEMHSKVRIEETSDGAATEKPRIKFRRLTGDILSTDKPQQIDSLTNEILFSSSSSPSAGQSSNAQISKPNFYTTESKESCFNPASRAPSHNHSDLSFKTMLERVHKPPKKTPELSLSSLLQSEPRAMIPPKAPPKNDMDIPLFKNVSKEFTITNVAEGVCDNDLLNFVFKQADTGPKGIQISQVISLNAGGKSVSPAPQLPDRVTSTERRSSPSSLGTFRNTPPARASPASMNRSISQRDTPPPPLPPPPPPSQALPKKPIPVKNAAFICCVAECCFSTNLRSTMNEHILSHIRSDNNRDALRCHLCSSVAQETSSYFKHMSQMHSTPGSTPSPCLTTLDLTQKIQDILRNTTKQNQASKEQEEEEEQPTTLQTQQPTELSFSDKLRNTANEIVADTGLSEDEIWRCIFYPECECSVAEKDFQTHLATHTSIVPTSFPSIPPGSSLNCPHCPVNYYRAAVLKAHMKTHARHQYFCFICSLTTFANHQQLQKHFNEIHSRSGTVRPQNMIPGDKSDKPSFFVANDTELSAMELIQFGEKLIVDWERKKALNKTHFKPNEQYLLPIQPIFNQQVCCSVCNYKTKVRTNMFRHLQLHNQDVDVGSVDPVNPVPCLEKNEKHFDKMLNLACSSNSVTGGGAGAQTNKPKEPVKIPEFVPDLRRYVCGHPRCKYLTLTDQMLRSHLNALHGSEKGYLCPHCQEEVCKKNMCAERIVQHLKFHGNKIYQCGECEYFHYTKHVVERHVNEKHPGVSVVNLLTYDRCETETKKSSIQLFPGKSGVASTHSASSHSAPGDSDIPTEQPSATSTTPSIKMKWECALCKHQTVTWNQMISHANSTHNAKHQYHCVHCTFGSSQLAHIMDHIDSKHPSKIREAKYVFYKINESLQDKAADTRPLWSRNDPKRVRSIRGILMEDEEDAKRTKENLSRSGLDLDEDLDDEYDDVVPVGDDLADVPKIPGGLSCFHCTFTCADIHSLSSHWKAKHWHEKNFKMVPRLPFFFRVHTILKCPLCTHVGDHISLKIHLVSQHSQRNFCAADPNLSNTCGHCPFVYPPKRLEILTNHYLREHKPTDVKNLSSGLLKHLLSLGECQVYMQCYFCAEICADKTAIIEHERDSHKNSNFRYKQIKDEVIYRCGMCQYSSTNELATLRHMIDHFSGFSFCHFCKSAQSSFNSYMQHCYSSHVKALVNFKEIYKFDTIATFLGQMLLIFPNGLIINKKNLQHTQYGNSDRIQAMYDEICKKALEPPIPPLCMGRLLAQKSLEASGQSLLPPPPNPVTAKRIAKRRSTVAMGGGEQGLSGFLVPSLAPQKIKKRKSSICGDFQQPTAPLFSTITSNLNSNLGSSVARSQSSADRQDAADVTPDPVIVDKPEPQGYSFYGMKPEPIDLSKIYTHIAIGDKYAPVSVKKFSLLFKINTKVMVEATDHRKYQAKKRLSTYSRPCPASKKKKMA